MKLIINSILAVAAFLAVAGSLKAGVYDHSAFGSNPLQAPPTIPIRWAN